MSANNNPETREKSKPAPVTGLALLREPFPAHQISKLPKPTKAQTEAVKTDFKKGIRCTVCGTWHHPDVVHLDYVGHAALTDRLLDADPHWSWEPVAFGQDGLPGTDRAGGMWIRLTVDGVTRLGYGHAGDKTGGDAVKEVIGDALRNAAMRFGAALDLWHKGDLHADEGGEDDKPKAEPPASRGPAEPPKPTLAERANRLESALRAKQGDADAVQAVWDRNAGLCADLDDKAPERLAELETLLKMLLATPDKAADPFSEAA